MRGNYLCTLSATNSRLGIPSSMSELGEIIFLIAGICSLHHCAGKLFYSVRTSNIRTPVGQELPDLDPSDTNLVAVN